jgi:hypothetical protein
MLERRLLGRAHCCATCHHLPVSRCAGAHVWGRSSTPLEGQKQYTLQGFASSAPYSVRDAAPAASTCPFPPPPPAPACLDQCAPEWSEKSMPAASPPGLAGASTTVSRFALKVALPALSITCPASSPKMWDSTPPVTPSSTVASTLPTRANVQRSCLSPQAFNGLMIT